MEEEGLGVGWDPGQTQKILNAWEACTIDRAPTLLKIKKKFGVHPCYNSSMKDQQQSETESSYVVQTSVLRMEIQEIIQYLHPRSMPADLRIWVVPGHLHSIGVWTFGSLQLVLIVFISLLCLNPMFAFEHIQDLHLFFKEGLGYCTCIVVEDYIPEEPTENPTSPCMHWFSFFKKGISYYSVICRYCI